MGPAATVADAAQRVAAAAVHARAADARDAARRAEARAARSGGLAAHLRGATVTLHDGPGGPVIGELGGRTGFGSPRVFAVSSVRPGWVGIRIVRRRLGVTAWVRRDALRLTRSPLRVVIDLSARRLRVSRDGRTLLRAPVAIGSPASPTPIGRYGVTDRIGMPAGSPYGCCAVALTGHQTRVPESWGGGRRLAVHGTTAPATIGQAASNGCLRASEATMHRLMATIPLGTTVLIRA